jgi:hypothetical protein
MSEQYVTTKLEEAAIGQESAFLPHELQKLFLFYNNELSVNQTAEQITLNVSRGQSAEEIDTTLYWLFNLLNDAAIHLPSFQLRIIALLEAIQKLPDLKIPEPEESSGVTLVQGDVFKKLPNWGGAWQIRLTVTPCLLPTVFEREMGD